jgi:hypothetical protein
MTSASKSDHRRRSVQFVARAVIVWRVGRDAFFKIRAGTFAIDTAISFRYHGFPKAAEL